MAHYRRRGAVRSIAFGGRPAAPRPHSLRTEAPDPRQAQVTVRGPNGEKPQPPCRAAKLPGRIAEESLDETGPLRRPRFPLTPVWSRGRIHLTDGRDE